MAENKEFNAESTDKKPGANSLVFVATGVALGLGAAAWLLKRRHDTKINWDPQTILDACDAAAAKLDDILFTEARQAG